MNVNEELFELYSSHYSSLREELLAVNNIIEKENGKVAMATNPLLIQVNDNYIKSDIKIMFFGQETNSWEGAFSGDIDKILKVYKRFYLLNDCYKRGGQFWNGIARFKKLLNTQASDKSIGYVWNNVLKIGKCGKGFPAKTNYLTNKHFKVVLKEIEILKPDFIIFLSGPNYDHLLQYVIGDFECHDVEGYSKRQLCKIKSGTNNLPIAYRTYHPNYLWRIGIDKYFNSIISDMLKHITTL